ncbi:MAG: type II secretion system F family protein [Nitrososphaerota archaeon]|nr:type II secretion system F family protein [Nitrososphaerota archaeon]
MKIPVGKIFAAIVAIVVTLTGLLVIDGVNALMQYSLQSIELSVIDGAIVGGVLVIDTLTTLSITNILDLRNVAVSVDKNTGTKLKKQAGKIPGSTKISEPMLRSIENDIFRGKGAKDPIQISKQYSSYTIIGAVILIPAAILLGLFVNVSLVAIGVIPLILYFTPKLQAQSSVTRRKNAMIDELGFASVYFTVMQDSGQPLNVSMEKMIDKDIFPGMENEARLVRTNIKRFGMNPVDALDEVAKNHPNDVFKNFINGYTAILRTGGQLEIYLRDRMKEYFEMGEARFNSYTQTVGTIGEALIIVFMLFPLVLVVGSILATPALVAFFMYIGISAIPIVGLAGMGLIKKSQPSSPDIYSGNFKPAIAAAVIGAVIGSVTLVPWIILGLPLALFMAVYGYRVTKQLRDVEAINSALPRFLREVSEKKKIGYDIQKAILGVNAESKFNRPFTLILDHISTQIKFGKQLSEIKIPMRSWAGRATFFILGQIAESGGGSSKDLEPLYSFINSYNTARHEAKIRVRMYKLLGYITPLVIPILAVLIINVIGGLTTIGGSAVSGVAPSGGNPVAITVAKSVLLLAIGMITVLTSAALGITMATASDFTPKNTLQPAILVVIAITAMVAVSVLPISISI